LWTGARGRGPRRIAGCGTFETLAFAKRFCIAAGRRGDADQRSHVKRKSLAKFSPNLLQCLYRNAWKGVIWKLSAGLSTGCVDNRNGLVKKPTNSREALCRKGRMGLSTGLPQRFSTAFVRKRGDRPPWLSTARAGRCGAFAINPAVRVCRLIPSPRPAPRMTPHRE
jgi:hypothetical protein